MTPTQSLIAEVRARLEKASPGPWKISARQGSGYMASIRTSVPFSKEVAFVTSNCGTTGGSLCDPDAQLIAHAPTDLARLLEIVECYEAALRDIECNRASTGYAKHAARALQAAEKIAGGGA